MTSHLQLFMAGDSTMANNTKVTYPQMGWGQRLQEFFQPNVLVRNHAVNGRSTKSFLAENRWDEMEKIFQPGDYVVIQFGHNDQKKDKERATEPFTTYKENLRYFIHRARSFKVTPILATSIARRHFDEDGELVDTHGNYPRAMKILAKEENIICLDMLQLTKQAIQSMGPERSKEWFVWIKPNQYDGFPNGAMDDTHLNEKGAQEVARIFVQALGDLNHPLVAYLRNR